MNIRVPCSAIDLAKSHAQLAVIVSAYRKAGCEGSFTAGYRSWADELGVGRQVVRAVVKNMLDKGYMRAEPLPGQGNARRFYLRRRARRVG